MDITVVISTMSVLFGAILLGYLLQKVGIIDELFNKKLSELIVKVTSPALVIASVCGKEILGTKGDVLVIFMLGIALYSILPLFAKIIIIPLRLNRGDSSIYQMLLIFANTAFIGYPVVSALYNEGAVFYASILHLPFNIMIFSYGIYLITKGSDTNKKIRLKDMISPGIISAFAALFIYLLDFPVPEPLTELLDMVGGVTIPLSMFVIGASLAAIPLKEVFKEYKIYPLALIKLILMPLLINLLLNQVLDNQMIIGIATVTVGLPSGSMSVMLSNQYNGNVRTASIGVFITTMISVLSIPLIAYWLL